MKLSGKIAVWLMVSGVAYALVPNFNQNTGRRLARYAIANNYTLGQLSGATANQALTAMGITDDETRTAVVAGWSEIQAEAIRVWKVNNPTPAEVTVAEVKALIREKFPNFTITKVSGKDDQFVIDLDGVE